MTWMTGEDAVCVWENQTGGEPEEENEVTDFGSDLGLTTVD